MASFPQTPLPVSMHIAPGANPADASTYQYTDITGDVQYDDAVRIQAGRQDEGSRVDTTSHQATLDDRSGNYSSRNPLGTWSGRLGKGTPVQSRVRLIDDLFARTVASGLGTDAVSGQAWTTNTTYSVNGTVGQCTFAAANTAATSTLSTVRSDDVDVFKITSLSAVATGAAWVDATTVRVQDSQNFFRVHTEYAVGGIIAVKITQIQGGNQTDLLAATNTTVNYSAGTKIRTRVQAIGPTIRIKVWLDGSAEPAAWTASANAPATTARDNKVGLYQWRVVGNTNAGSLTATFYEYRCDSIRATTPVPAWSGRWDQTGTFPTSPIAGAGILRRLSQGQTALRSPMYRNITGYSNLIGYWPIEDGTDSTSISNMLPNGTAGSAQGMQLGGAGPSGSAAAATFLNSDPSSKIAGSFVRASTTAGWQISWSCKLAALPAALNQMIAWFTTNGYWWAINLNSGVYIVNIIDPSGNTVVSSNIGFTGTGDPNQWVTFRMKATVSGGTVSWAFAWFVQNAGTVWGSSGTFAGSVGALKSWTANGNPAMVNGSICQVFGVTTGNDDLQTLAATSSFDGYSGELAGVRAARLATEEGVPIIVMGDPTLTAPMGVQAPGGFLDLIRECEDADQGLIIERGTGLGFLTYGFRTNVPVTMALNFSSAHIAAPPEPTDDDLRLINTVKLTRKGGSEVTIQDDASVDMSGAYVDERTVNLFSDGQLLDQAGWRLHMGTVDELRWPQITLQLHRNPSLIYTWCAMRIGSRITIQNPPAVVAGSQLDLIVEGYTETISSYTWDVVLNCSPATPWDVGLYDTARYDSQTSTLAEDLDTTETAWDVTATALGDCWDTAAVPYAVLVGGELCTVTAATAPAGTGPYTQTLTCTRSVNGIVKTHITGESINIATPGRYSL